jgi:hypothetical protein
MADESLMQSLIGFAIEGWSGARHEVDALYIVVQELPNWQGKLREALDDPFRRQMTDDRFDPLRQAVLRIIHEDLSAEEGYSLLKESLALTQKSPN